MIRNSIRVLALGLLAAACGSAPKPSNLITLDGGMKDAQKVARLKAGAPDVWPDVEHYYAEANKAYEDGDEEKTNYYSELAAVSWATAAEEVRIADADAAVKASEAQIVDATAQKAEADASLADWKGRVDRMERIQAMQAQQQLSQADRDRLANELAAARQKSAALSPLAEQKQILTEAAAVPTATAVQDPRGIVITLNDLFVGSKTTVQPSRANALAVVANLAKKYPSYQLTVDGYTTAKMADATALNLSQARAQAVANYLVDAQKVEATRVRPTGHGKETPADGSTSKSAKNRVDIVFVTN
jgi:outer membrane protein OmpA-like peptidoglycan-associated protein